MRLGRRAARQVTIRLRVLDLREVLAHSPTRSMPERCHRGDCDQADVAFVNSDDDATFSGLFGLTFTSVSLSASQAVRPATSDAATKDVLESSFASLYEVSDRRQRAHGVTLTWKPRLRVEGSWPISSPCTLLALNAVSGSMFGISESSQRLRPTRPRSCLP